MNISVLTPDNEIFYGNITSVKVPSIDGQFQVLNNHAPIVAAMGNGTVEIVTGDGEYSVYNDETNSMDKATENGKRIGFTVTGGFIEVLNNEVSLLVRGVKF